VIARVRRLLLIPAAALVLVGAPALAVGGPALAVDGPALPRPTTTRVPLVAATAGGTRAAANDVGAGWTGSAEVDADLVGVTWAGDPKAEFRIEARYRGSDWQAAGDIGPADVAPDDGTADTAAAAAARRNGNPNATEPVWIGDADAVRVTIVEGRASAVTLEAVNAAPASPSDAAIPTQPAPASSSDAAIPTQPAITMRSQWGADLGWNPSPDCAPGPAIARNFKFAVVHHTVNSNSYSPVDSTSIVRAIWQYHVGTLGYCDIAYNFLIDRYGQTFEGRMGGIDQAVIAAHTGGFNTSSTGVAWIGDWTNEQPPPPAWDAMVNLLAWKLSLHAVNPQAGFTTTSNGGGSHWPAGTVVSFPNAILGHRDLWPTECPGNAFYPRLGELRQAVQPRIGSPDVPPLTPIGEHYFELGGPSSFLGAPLGSEEDVAGGRVQRFQGGAVYWSLATGAHEVHGAIRALYESLGGPASFLGYPITDESPTPVGSGRYNHFQGGSIYWSPVTGAHEVHGAIRDKWSSLGWELGLLGFPVTNETPTFDGVGRSNGFQGGAVYWSPATGAREVHGAIRALYESLGGPASFLGYPITDESPTPVGTGRYNHFQHGSIDWTPTTGATVR
jgi:uncharacterized protein with LGFP repeats